MKWDKSPKEYGGKICAFPTTAKPNPPSIPFTQRRDIGIGGDFIAFKHVVHASSSISFTMFPFLRTIQCMPNHE